MKCLEEASPTPECRPALTENRSNRNIVRKGGMAFFLVLNDHCDREEILRKLDEFEREGVDCLILHPRDGLLLPYGGGDWFAFIRWLAHECLRRGIEPVLYDEDPFPSGNAGGRIVFESPELAGRAIERFEAQPDMQEGDVFIFPAGRLLWAGMIDRNAPDLASVDLSANVGTLRRHWEKAEWDSRWYYAATPLYSCPRAVAHRTEYALRCPKIPEGWSLVAFLARPITKNTHWGGIVDMLDRRATRRFIELTHEKYKTFIGEEFGRSIHTIFTDEAKPHAVRPWTASLFPSFEKTFGYDLRHKLECIFRENDSPGEMKVRLDYREWVTKRFLDCWVKPVASWCRRNRLNLIGHFSPEEDPVNQSATLGNLFPLQRHLSLGGYDLIIPAIGDDQHTLLNVAAVAAVSSAQQNRKPGVCGESLGLLGLEASPRLVARILAWQVIQGISVGVVHGAFTSQLGLRRFEAPPDYGPDSESWKDISRINTSLKPFLQATANARHEAPVAILWPILSFQALGHVWQEEAGGIRQDLTDILGACLAQQVGTQLLDERDLQKSVGTNGRIRLGYSEYRHVIIPSCLVLSEKTVQALDRFQAGGGRVEGVGTPPRWLRRTDNTLVAFSLPSWPVWTVPAFISDRLPHLPKVIDLPVTHKGDFRAARWTKGLTRNLMLMNLSAHSRTTVVSGNDVMFQPGELVWFKLLRNRWEVDQRFRPEDFPDRKDANAHANYGEWVMTAAGGSPVRAQQPLSAWQLIPTSGDEFISLTLTGSAHIGGGTVAKEIVYQTTVRLPTAGTTEFVVEPTLMNGRFTLEIGDHHWNFSVHDVDKFETRLDITTAVSGRKNVPLRFILHEPEAMHGIKANPRIVVIAPGGSSPAVA